MNVGDLFRDLSLGELRNLYLGSSGGGYIDDADKDRIVYYANRSLTKIFSRFIARKAFVDLVQIADRKVYQISSTFAQSNTDSTNTAVRYLADAEEDPYRGDLIKVLGARLAPCEEFPDGLSLIVNGDVESIGVKALGHDKLMFDTPVEGRVIQLELQMDHPKLSFPANEDELIEVHPLLVEALHVKVAAGVYSSMNGQEQLAKSQLLDAQFEAIAGLIDNRDLTQGSTIEDAGPVNRWGFK